MIIECICLGCAPGDDSQVQSHGVLIWCRASGADAPGSRPGPARRGDFGVVIETSVPPTILPPNTRYSIVLNTMLHTRYRSQIKDHNFSRGPYLLPLAFMLKWLSWACSLRIGRMRYSPLVHAHTFTTAFRNKQKWIYLQKAC